ncbi:MAG: carbon-nitrogen hydrolase family protein [Phycisphaerae bacterium]|nr:carbon-nitrogen hydrolase family protein [Phycisphaerae bacterium]NUQ45896.1 carbon-nitrogen hydrolase family protein [Phycisphaerae bacterium]
MFRVAIGQIASAFLNREAATARVVAAINRAAEAGCQLVAFGEALIPAYPLWICRTDGARFDNAEQKALHALYLDQAVAPDRGHLDPISDAARRGRIAVVLGIAERAADRGGHSLFCSRVVIDGGGKTLSIHRKLMPTYEERLAWGIGDGAGLVTHAIGPFMLGALNCWENWLPLARAALYAAGEDLHVMLWPGSANLTRDITRFVAMESRSFVLSASAIVRESDLPADMPLRERIAQPGEMLCDGGSCIAGPDGRWMVEPVVGREELLVADLDPARVREERHNFDPAGHYARPDVLRLIVDRRRLRAADFLDDET